MSARKKSAPGAAAPGTPTPSAPLEARKRLILVDDHPMMRAGLAQLINKHPDLEVCCEAGNAAEALAEIPRCQPDLMLTDITMPGR